MIHEARTPSSQIEVLTVARGFFAWWVVFFHMREWLPSIHAFGLSSESFWRHGYLGVDFFFVLSGFVIQHRYREDFKVLTMQALKDFGYSRFARIYPLHIVLLCVMLVDPIALSLFSKAKAVSAQYPLDYFLLSTVLIQNWGFADELRWNVPAWSISSELVAYLVFPFWARLLYRTGAKPNVTPVVFGLACLALLAMVFSVLGLSSIGDRVTVLGSIRCVLEFCAGCCAANIARQMSKSSNGKITAAVLGAFAVVLAAFGYASNLADYLYIPLSVACGIVALGSGHLVQNSSLPKALVYLGNISYSTYLCHWILKGWFIFADVPVRVHGFALVASYCLAVLLASGVLYRYVEVPMQSYLRSRARGHTPNQRVAI